MQAVQVEQEINEKSIKKSRLNLRNFPQMEQIKVVGESKVEFALLQTGDRPVY